ncbi:MCP four helix bundle domain-containing protein [Echinicola marina]|uniref:MCP four helix bundle domain-containing protein n=1 Tax=Echinicola marina TaxID=2859768 RepID=UPI001CF6F82A|nr:MCP four helix bundle domain-containing protein [Echinicola marina]UCS91938.1 MCP four helix bundle domain-containing protein [Echinicola marina]
MTVFNKIKWSASILLVFIIVLTTNLIDKDNFQSLSNSVKTIYEDRIVASDLLFEMSTLIHHKEIAIISSDSSYMQSENSPDNEKLDNYMLQYSKTKLTEKEQFLFEQLKDDIATLKHSERNHGMQDKSKWLSQIDKVNQRLYDLSKIQLEESRRQVFISNKAKDTINFFTQGEIILLILLSILIQVIIFYKPKGDKKS